MTTIAQSTEAKILLWILTEERKRAEAVRDEIRNSPAVYFAIHELWNNFSPLMPARAR